MIVTRSRRLAAAPEAVWRVLADPRSLRRTDVHSPGPTPSTRSVRGHQRGS